MNEQLATALERLEAHGGRLKTSGGTYCRICQQDDPCDVRVVMNALKGQTRAEQQLTRTT